ncbi:unnamed protein product, partial [Dibothriocephalus latus]
EPWITKGGIGIVAVCRTLQENDGIELAPGRRLTDLDYGDDIALSIYGVTDERRREIGRIVYSTGFSTPPMTEFVIFHSSWPLPEALAKTT